MALAVRPELCGGRLFVEPLAGSEAEKYPAGIEHRERGERLSDDRRVIAIDRDRHTSAERDIFGSFAHQRQSDPREHRMPLVLLERLDMTAGPQVAKSGLL